MIRMRESGERSPLVIKIPYDDDDHGHRHSLVGRGDPLYRAKYPITF